MTQAVCPSVPDASTLPYEGMVIFYDVKTGVGQINSTDGAKYSFNHKAVEGLWIPGAGDRVRFCLADPEHNEGLHPVKSVCWIKGEDDAGASSDTIVCPHCKKSVHARVAVYEGQPDASYCPECGGKISEFARSDKVFWLVLCLTLIAVTCIAFWSFA